MNIDITEKWTPHCWVVHLDALEVNFDSQEAANAFVGQLKGRIAAPHAWPVPVRSGTSNPPATAKEQAPGFAPVE